MTTEDNREVITQANQQVATMASRIRGFTRMNPPTFYGSKVREDPHEFIIEFYRILYAMGLTTSEKAELDTYQLKGKGTSSPNKKPTCAKCGKGHVGKCLVGMGNCFGCGKRGDKVRDCPNVKGQDKGSVQVSGSNDALKKNPF
ncbi:hypothetical protein EJD97_020446 [Solanum chilense]|uniref:CCHC-type domain-containing protein n=1 Tax=Solanum chilense TaxID=4083 RepID=A0A6N2B543_SOLCI|nr:hypothetical protein EJD97_020446 [Solanum chilense]